MFCDPHQLEGKKLRLTDAQRGWLVVKGRLLGREVQPCRSSPRIITEEEIARGSGTSFLSLVKRELMETALSVDASALVVS